MSEQKSTQPGIASRLFREGYQFDFFQSVTLLELFMAGGKSPGETSDLNDERIRFRPHHGHVFPSSDVQSIEQVRDGIDRARLTVTFMGLYGIDSPLPGWFHEPIARDPDNAQALRDFLDMFNHRLYALFYRSWAKYRLFRHYSRPPARRTLLARVLSLGGLGTPGITETAGLRAVHLAAFTGILSSRVRNAEALRNMLAEFLPGIPVSILENVPRWVRIPKRSRLGRTQQPEHILSRTSALGQQANDLSGKFRIVLGPLTLQQYLSLFLGGERTKAVNYLIRLYIRDSLAYDVQLRLKTSEIPPLRLADRALRVGLTTWLGRPQAESTSRLVEYEDDAHSFISSGAL